MANGTLGFFYSNLFLTHLEGYSHPERPARLSAILERVKYSKIAGGIAFFEAEPAERAWIERIHDSRYVETMLSLKADRPVILDWGDTVATSGTPRAAQCAAGAGVQAVRMVIDESLSCAFCAVRPPGHHAVHARAMGFCIFNNIAIAAADLLDKAGLKRVAIIDWDVHHGNGTEQAFIGDPRVLYTSLHQYPHFPGTGGADIKGIGRGLGYNINVPLRAGTEDSEFLGAFTDIILPAVERYRPEFILISAGFDAHKSDPMADLCLTTSAFGKMTRLVRESADRLCGGRIVSFLEGGYDLQALADCVEEHLAALIS